MIPAPCDNEFNPDSSIIRYDPFGGNACGFCKKLATVWALVNFSFFRTSTAELVGAIS